MEEAKLLSRTAGLLAALVLTTGLLWGRGMPAAERDAIHGLFDNHAAFQREVSLTEDGYVSRTTSDNPEAVELLQTHVKQMESRLKKGLMVRGWDPAYVEFVNHYDDIDIQITVIENGISIVAKGRTEAAREVARNHAGIVSKFIDHGWKEHNKAHAPVFGSSDIAEGMETKGGNACCQMDQGEIEKSGDACPSDGGAGCMMGDMSKGGDGRGPSCCQASG